MGESTDVLLDVALEQSSLVLHEDVVDERKSLVLHEDGLPKKLALLCGD